MSDLASTRPDLAAEWSRERNTTVSLLEISHKSGRKVWWTCLPRGHEWLARVADRSSGKGCPFCSGRRPIPGETDLASTHPSIAAEWHPRNSLSPDEVSAKSGRKVWWACPKNHEWQAVVSHRTGGTGCPRCVAKISKPERELYRLLVRRLPDLVLDARIPVAGWVAKVARCDMASENQRLVVEYDGWFYHKDRRPRDDRKTDALIAAGWTVLRVRASAKNHRKLALLQARDGLIQIEHDIQESATDLADRVLIAASTACHPAGAAVRPDPSIDPNGTPA